MAAGDVKVMGQLIKTVASAAPMPAIGPGVIPDTETEVTLVKWYFPIVGIDIAIERKEQAVPECRCSCRRAGVPAGREC